MTGLLDRMSCIWLVCLAEWAAYELHMTGLFDRMSCIWLACLTEWAAYDWPVWQNELHMTGLFDRMSCIWLACLAEWAAYDCLFGRMSCIWLACLTEWAAYDWPVWQHTEQNPHGQPWIRQHHVMMYTVMWYRNTISNAHRRLNG